MKIAIIVPALVNQGPVTVARDIVSGILEEYDNVEFVVFYFDELTEIEFPCKTIQINLWKSIDFSEFSVIHTHMLRPDFYVWLNRHKTKNILKISTLHQNIVANLSASYNKLIAKTVFFFWIKFLKSFDKIVALSDVMKNTYASKFSKDSLLTIYNGRKLSKPINKIEAEEEKKIFELKSKYNLIGVVALLTWRKGIHQLIEALTGLPNYALIIVGSGQELEVLKSLAIKLGVETRCYFLGYKKNGLDYMQYFDIFAMTSYSEGFPLSVLEVSQFNKPVVCSNIPLFKEIFTEKEVSFFELDNTESLKNALLCANENKDDLSSNLNIKVNEKYSYKMMINSYMELYKLAENSKNNIL